MKINVRFQVLAIALFFLAVSNNYSQDRFGGLTLYTVREDMKTNPKEVLKEIADMNYKFVEATGYENGKYYGMLPVDFKNYLHELDLVPVSTHQGGVTFENVDKVIADVKAGGFKYFVIPIPPMGHFKYDKGTRTMGMSDDIEFVTNFLNVVGKKCKEAGLELLYHNHDFEYKKNSNGIVPIEYFLNNTDPEYVNFQMDLYWVTKAGADPVAYFEKYPGRFKMWHVKDMDKEGKFAPVGNGTIDFARILKKKDLSGLEYYIVEQDMTFDLKPMEAIKISHEGLKKFGFK